VTRRHIRVFLFAALFTAPPAVAAASAADLAARDEQRRVPWTLLPEGGVSGAERLSDWQDIRATFREIRFHLAHPTLKEGLSYAGIALGALYLEQNKYGLSGEFQEDRSDRSDAVSAKFRPLGEGIVPIAALATYAVGRFSGSEQTRRAGLILSESAFFTVLATEIGQFVLSEQRPDEGGKLRFFSYGGHGVSGHTSIIASISVPLDRLFFQVAPGDGRWMKAGKYVGKGVVYAAPVMTGWSRVNDNKHYVWNTVLGLGTGFMIGSFVASAHGLDGGDHRERNWNVVPISDDHGAPGLALRWAMR
jgi:hypothetical protein